MEKVFYEVDPFNRLIVRNPPGRASMIKRFRQVVFGRFKTDEDNALYYEVNKSSGLDIPQKIKFSGKYSLEKNRHLILTLNKWNNQCEGNRLALNARMIDANSNEIAFLLTSRAAENKSLTYIMRFSGSWQADGHNRLTFWVERDGKDADNLILSGAWELNKNNEVVYRHGNDTDTVIFRGRWDIGGRRRINYVLDKKLGSGFSFRTSFGTVAPEGKDTYVTFDIGIGISKARKLHRKVVLTGKWKISKDKEIVLETSDAEAGGLILRFTKEMFDSDAIAYIESVVKDREKFIGGGIAFKW